VLAIAPPTAKLMNVCTAANTKASMVRRTCKTIAFITTVITDAEGDVRMHATMHSRSRATTICQ
jgi:hypothetical protein